MKKTTVLIDEQLKVFLPPNVHAGTNGFRAGHEYGELAGIRAIRGWEEFSDQGKCGTFL